MTSNMAHLAAKLNSLSFQNRQADSHFQDWNAFDSVDHLPEGKINGWKKILSSASSTEGLEKVLMIEIGKAFLDHPEIYNYLESHQADEVRHQAVMNRYLKKTFQYTKMHRTLTDKLIYDSLLPKIARVFSSRPICGLALLLFFESYATLFYKKIRKAAQTDQLSKLSNLIGQIEKDEFRHLAGIRLVLAGLISKTRWYDKALTALLLRVAVFDLNMSKWAIYNKKVRQGISRIGLDPDLLTHEAHVTAKNIYGYILKREF